MSKFRKRVIIGLENILNHIDEVGCKRAVYGICGVNLTRNSGKIRRDVGRYLSLYFDCTDYYWDGGEIAPRKKWLKKHIKRLKELEK